MNDDAKQKLPIDPSERRVFLQKSLAREKAKKAFFSLLQRLPSLEFLEFDEEVTKKLSPGLVWEPILPITAIPVSTLPGTASKREIALWIQTWYVQSAIQTPFYLHCYGMQPWAKLTTSASPEHWMESLVTALPSCDFVLLSADTHTALVFSEEEAEYLIFLFDPHQPEISHRRF